MGLGDIGASLYTSLVDLIVPLGTISAQNALPAGAASANSVFVIPTNGKSTASFQVVTNTLNVPLSAYGSLDGANWLLIGGSPLLNQATGRFLPTIPAAGTGVFTLNCADFAFVRISTPNSVTTGSSTVLGEGGANPAIITAEAPQYNLQRAIATLTAKSGAGVLHSLSIAATLAAPTAGLLTIYDNTTATGAVIYTEWVPAGVLAHNVVLDTSFLVGLTIGFDGTLAGVAITAALI